MHRSLIPLLGLMIGVLGVILAAAQKNRADSRPFENPVQYIPAKNDPSLQMVILKPRGKGPDARYVQASPDLSVTQAAFNRAKWLWLKEHPDHEFIGVVPVNDSWIMVVRKK